MKQTMLLEKNTVLEGNKPSNMGLKIRVLKSGLVTTGQINLPFRIEAVGEGYYSHLLQAILEQTGKREFKEARELLALASDKKFEHLWPPSGRLRRRVPPRHILNLNMLEVVKLPQAKKKKK